MREYRGDYVQGLHQRISELEENLADAVELDVENARLRAALARLTAAASIVAAQPPITVNREAWLDQMNELSAAIAEATAALKGGEDDTKETK